jgi:hypothetical protein
MKRNDWIAAGLLAASLGTVAWLRVMPEAKAEAFDLTAPQSAAAWTELAGRHWTAGERQEALRACEAALRIDPRHGPALLRMTDYLLDLADAERLLDWMDSLVLDDPRLAEQLFKKSAFEPWLREEPFRRLRDEAVEQARD